MVMVRSGDPKYLNRVVESKDLSQYTCSIHTSSLGPKQDSELEGLMVQGFQGSLGFRINGPWSLGAVFVSMAVLGCGVLGLQSFGVLELEVSGVWVETLEVADFMGSRFGSLGVNEGLRG